MTGVTTEMALAWSGNAADAAAAYFADFEAGLLSVEAALRDLAEEYDRTALGIYMACDAACSAIEMCIDYGLGALVSAAAAMATIETGIGLIIGGAASWWATSKAVEAFDTAVDAYDAAVLLAELFSGGCAAGLSLLRGLDGTRIPGQTFDSPRT